MLMRPTVSAVTMPTAVLLAASLGLAHPARADTVDSLAGAVQAVHSSAGCTPLQADPLLMRAAQMATQETSDYLSHRSAALPFTDPMPALQTIGYTGSKALILSGYGLNEANSIQGLVVQGYKALPDCSYVKYGSSALEEDGSVFTAILLAPS